jgi:hypothetical protein
LSIRKKWKIFDFSSSQKVKNSEINVNDSGVCVQHFLCDTIISEFGHSTFWVVK